VELFEAGVLRNVLNIYYKSLIYVFQEG